jgi:PadR family transcriptional regulator, regulatory protein AphA
VGDATRATGADSQLSLTEYAVLGLLSFGPASGYELDQLAGRSLDYFWRPAKSKIYATLPRLAEQGFARARAFEQAGRPDKQVYTLTAAGRRTLRRWLNDEALPAMVVRNGLLLKLFFGAEADERNVRRALAEARDRATAQLAALKEIETRIDADADADFFPYLTLLHGIEDAESTVRWATDALERLERKSRSAPIRRAAARDEA